MRLIRLTVDIALRGGCFAALVVAYSYAEVAGGAHLPAHVAPTLALFGCAALGAVCDGARVAWTALCLGAVGGLRAYRAAAVRGGHASQRAAELAKRAAARLDALEFAAFVAFAAAYCLAPRRRPGGGAAAAPTFGPWEAEVRRLLVARRATEDLHRVDGWLADHRGREADLLRDLERRYAADADGRPADSPGLRAVAATATGLRDLSL